MTDPRPTPTPTPLQDPPPAAWLRGAGLVALLVFIALDVIPDSQLDADLWTYTVAVLAVIYGPSVLRRRN